MIRYDVTLFFPLLVLWLCLTGAAAYGEIPLPEEEAPTALFSAELYDAEVDFFIEGSWTASIQSGAGIRWGDGISGIQPAMVSDFADGFRFEQVPQLTLSLWYMDRYFFETSITEEQQLETFLFGYFGEEGEFLQEARFGNTDIGYGDYGLFSIPEASRHSLGGYGRFESNSTEHHLAARYDPAQLEELHYRGSRLIEEQRIPPESFIRGRFFILPDKEVESLKVYVRDDQKGSLTDTAGRNYRRLKDEEMVYSAAEGVLYLTSPADSEVLVYYEKNGLTVGEPSLGTGALCGIENNHLSLDAPSIDFSWDAGGDEYDDYFSFAGIDDFSDWGRTISGNGGQPSLLLYSPGTWNPFELMSVYATEAPVEAESGDTLMWLSNVQTPGGNKLTIEQFQDTHTARIAVTGASIRSFRARYPLLYYTDLYSTAQSSWEQSPWAEFIYSPTSIVETGISPPPVDKELRLEQLSPAGSYNLGTNVLEGSITVQRNGVPEQRFSFNPDTGELSFFIPPGRTERVDIKFRTASARSVGGDIFAATVNSFTFNEHWSANFNAGLRWNADPNAYIVEPGESEGSILAAGRLTYQSDNVRFELESGLNVRSPNTTGRLRLFGMDDSAFPVQIHPELMYPGAPVTTGTTGAYETLPEGLGESPGGEGLPHSSRGALFYSDYYNYSFAGGYELKHYSWDPPDDQKYPYADPDVQSGRENRTGPYIAGTGNETEGNAMVLEYSLEIDEWVGGTIPIADRGGARDLSHVRAITLLVKHIGRNTPSPTGQIDMHLLIGRLNEDLDADSSLDEEDSPLDKGFDFNISYNSHDFILPVAPPLIWSPSESRVNSEDLDGNDVLEGSRGSLSEPVVKSIAPASGTTADDSSTSWRRITIPLTPEDRERLKAGTGIEFIVKALEGTSAEGRAEGRLLIADIDLQGSPFTGSTAEGTGFSVFTRALDPGAGSYDSLMDRSEAKLLNEKSVFNTKVLRLQWEGPTAADSEDQWTVTAYHTPLSLDEYGSLSFFLRTPSGPPPERPPERLILSLHNPQNEGMAVAFKPPENSEEDSKWRRYTWDLHTSDNERRITVDGNPIPGGGELVGSSRGIDHNSSASGVNTLTLSGDIREAGACEIDEIYLHDPRLDIGAGGRSALEYRHQGALISIAEVPLLHKIHFRQTVYGRQEGYQGGLSPAPASRLAFTNELGFHFLQSTIDLHYNGQWDELNYLPAGGYGISIPLGGKLLQINDSYREQHINTADTDSAVDISRTAGVSAESPQQSGADFTSSLLWENAVLDRRWDFSARFQEYEGFRLSLNSGYQSRNSDISPDEESLGARYVRFTELILPSHTSGPRFRKTDHELRISAQKSGLSAHLSHSLGTATSPQHSPFSLIIQGGWNMQLKAVVGELSGRTISITHRYKRSGDFEQAYGEKKDFSDDLATLPDRLGASPLIWTHIPYLELWDHTLETEFEDKTLNQIESTYSGRSELSIDRTPGSMLYDLFAPTRFSFGIERNLKRELESIHDRYLIDGLYRATALNLFGRLGRYPLFKGYRTEEVSHSLLYSGSFGGEEESHQFTLSQFLELNLSQHNVIGIDNSWKESIGEEKRTISSRLYRKKKNPFTPTLPFEDKLKLEGENHIEHTDELEYSFSIDGGTVFTHRITAGHTSLLTLGERGTLSGFSRVGYICLKNTDVEEETVQHNLAVEIGMELTLSF